MCETDTTLTIHLQKATLTSQTVKFSPKATSSAAKQIDSLYLNSIYKTGTSLYVSCLNRFKFIFRIYIFTSVENGSNSSLRKYMLQPIKTKERKYLSRNLPGPTTPAKGWQITLIHLQIQFLWYYFSSSKKFLDVVDIFMHSMLQKAVSSSDTVTPRSNPIILDEKSTRMLIRPALLKRHQKPHKVLQVLGPKCYQNSNRLQTIYGLEMAVNRIAFHL